MKSENPILWVRTTPLLNRMGFSTLTVFISPWRSFKDKVIPENSDNHLLNEKQLQKTNNFIKKTNNFIYVKMYCCMLIGSYRLNFHIQDGGWDTWLSLIHTRSSFSTMSQLWCMIPTRSSFSMLSLLWCMLSISALTVLCQIHYGWLLFFFQISTTILLFLQVLWSLCCKPWNQHLV